MTRSTWRCAVCGAAAEWRAPECRDCGQPRLISLVESAAGGTHRAFAAAEAVITLRDRAILDSAVRGHPRHDPFVLLVARRKLAGARQTSIDDVPPDVATLHSRVAFAVDDGPTEERVLAGWSDPSGADGRLSIGTRRGICLLGLRPGARVAVARHDGSSEQLVLREVRYQPERARRELRDRFAEDEGRPVRRFGDRHLRLVPERSARHLPQPDPDGDDPGPAAA